MLTDMTTRTFLGTISPTRLDLAIIMSVMATTLAAVLGHLAG